MNRDRFETLAEAYGGDIARWPADARDAAAALMVAEPAFTRQVLARAAALDGLLGAYPSPAPTGALIGAILGASPAAPPRRRWTGWLLPAGLGAGLAAAGVAGLLVGAQLYEQSAEDDPLVAAASEGFSLYLEEEA